MPRLRPFPSGTPLLLAALILFAGNTASAASAHLTQSQQLKKRVLALENDEQFLAAFAVAADRLQLAVPPTHDNRDEFLDALTDLTMDAAACGQLSLADELARVLLRESTDDPGVRDVRTAAAWRIEANVARLFGRQGEAWMGFEQSRCILETIGETQSDEYGRYLWGMGNWYRWVNLNASLAFLSQSKEMRDEIDGSPSRDLADRTTWVGWTMLHLGHHDEARAYLERARAIYLELGLTRSSTLGTVYAAQGDLAAVDGDWSTAEQLYRQAIPCFESAWAKRGASNHNMPLHGYQLIAFAQLRQGKHEEAWESLEKYRSGQATRVSVGSARWRVERDPGYERIQKLYDELRENRASAQAAKEAPGVGPETWSALLEQLDLTARCSRAESEYTLKHPLREASLARLQSCLDDRTAYIGWLDAKFADDMYQSTGPFLNARWMYTIRNRGAVDWHRVSEATTRDEFNARSAKERDFNKVLKRAASWRERIGTDPDLVELSQHEYQVVFGPSLFDLKGVDRLVAEVACYDEWIHTDELIDPSGHYVAERYAVSYSPSGAIYLALAASKPKNQDDRLLAIGDPVFSLAQAGAPASSDTRIDAVTLRSAVNRDPAALDKLPRLPYSGRELDRLQALFPDATVLRGKDASETALEHMASRNELCHYRMIHVASHALVDPAPERCAIALSRTNVDGTVANDGLVDTPEIRMSWKLDADLVTLSACQTAGVMYHRGEPMGFAQALFQAGARCVLLSFWKVDDEATSMLMSRFYENIAEQNKPVSYANALMEAKNWLRTYTNAKGKHPFAHPVYWAGFVLMGDAD